MIFVKGVYICRDESQGIVFAVDFNELELNRDRASIPNQIDKARKITIMLAEIINNFDQKYSNVGIPKAQIINDVYALLSRCSDTQLHIGGALASLLTP